MLSSPYLLKIYTVDTTEQAAMALRAMRSNRFPLYEEPLQIMFTLPNVDGAVLFKSFEIFYEHVNPLESY